MKAINSPSKGRINFTLAVTLFVVLHLTIEMLTGGVRVHYPLMRDDLPALSNWWGLILLPSMAWVFYSAMPKDDSSAAWFGLNRTVLYRLGGAFLYGGAMGAAFELGLGEMPAYMMLALLVMGIAYPLYRAEIVLGLIMGMTYSFGSIIPTVAVGVVALSSLLLHTLARVIVRGLRPQTQ